MRTFVFRAGKTLDPNVPMPISITQGLKEVLDAMAGKMVEITIKAHVKKRSGNQNRYYYGVVIPAVRQFFAEIGETLDDEETHLYLKQEIGKLRRAVRGPEGEYHYLLKSTAKLTTTEFEEYMTAIRAWAAQQGCDISEPNESSDYFPPNVN